MVSSKEIIQVSANVDTKKLKKLIKDKGYTYTEIGRQVNNTYTNMNKKLNNIVPFKWLDVLIICELLELNNWNDIKNIFSCNAESNIKKVS